MKALVAIGAAAVLGLSACGDSEEPTPEPTFTPQPAPTQPAPPTQTDVPQSQREQAAVAFFEEWYGIDLPPADEQVFLNDAYICIDQRQAGWSYTDIHLDNLNAYDGDWELSYVVMAAAFIILAPEYAAEYEAWSSQQV